nr:hypothetical protein [Pseudomonas sp. MWU13-3659]
MAEPDLSAPQTHWGWLASLAPGDWAAWLSHWRARVMVGYGLYRFHDNRVLARALDVLAPAELPAYLGPTINLCYWRMDGWRVVDNPAPGSYPVPSEPAWLPHHHRASALQPHAAARIRPARTYGFHGSTVQDR